MNNYSHLIKKIAKDLGFDFCGISKAEFLETQAPRLENWLSKKHQADMSWMERNFDKRLDPRILVPGAKSVVSLLMNYYPNESQNPNTKYKVSKYAYGRDYHFVLKEKCKFLIERIRESIGDVNGRAFTDSAPVMDKVWAEKGGLGWIGKNSNLISKQNGSFFFIAEIILDLELEADSPIGDYCGTCTACIDACPTQAIVEPYVVDGSKCISYLTIELKENISDSFKGKMDNWIFGCDVCQDVCPWNKFSKPTRIDDFSNTKQFVNWKNEEWEEITHEVFTMVFKESPIKRTKFSGLKRNIDFVKPKKEDA